MVALNVQCSMVPIPQALRLAGCRRRRRCCHRLRWVFRAPRPRCRLQRTSPSAPACSGQTASSTWLCLPLSRLGIAQAASRLALLSLLHRLIPTVAPSVHDSRSGVSMSSVATCAPPYLALPSSVATRHSSSGKPFGSALAAPSVLRLGLYLCIAD